MLSPKLLLLHGYYGAHYPYRRWLNIRRAAAGRAAVTVLGYHRIADDRATPWTQSKRSFARQIDWLKRNFDLISLGEAQRRLTAGQNFRSAVCVTFDDGYAENCEAALPLLLREGVPCTYFVTTRNALERRPFDHDLALGHSLSPNSVDELRELSAAGIEIGAHTRTHANLGPISQIDRLHDEIVGAAEDLAEAIGKPVRYFAFPFGQHENLNATAFEIGRDHGFEAMCSAYGGFNFPGDDSFHLQRIMTDEELIRIKNWVTVDPRKLNSVRRYEYQPAPVVCHAAANAIAG